MNAWTVIGSRNFVVYGTGHWAEYTAKRFSGRIDYFVDSNPAKWGSVFYGKEVKNPDVLQFQDDAFVVIATSDYYIEIAKHLLEMSFSYRRFTVFLSLLPEKELASIWPVLDTTIDVCQFCNSHCTMCTIWKNKGQNLTLNLDKFREYISDRFLINLRSFNITGGEPTLVKELPQYVDFALKSLPALERVIISINCINKQRTINAINTINTMCESHGVSFQVNISLNGVGSVHDITRGTPGNFDSAVSVLHAIRGLDKHENINIVVNARIVKSNVYDMEEFIYFLQKEKLYNNAIYPAGIVPWFIGKQDAGELDFDFDALYQIELLTVKLPIINSNNRFEKVLQLHNFIKRRTGIELADCRRAEGHHLTLLCDTKKLLCNTFLSTLYEKEGVADLSETYKTNSALLGYIKQVGCSSCTFCPCIEPNRKYDEFEKAETYWHDFYTISAYYARRDFVIEEIAISKRQGNDQYTILITGWYGTETVGDKAILGQIFNEIRAARPDAKIQITSMYPFVTERTLYELGQTAQIVPIYAKDALYAAAQADEIIMGGGPLMEMECLAIPLWLFDIARQSGGKTVVRGCGIGPVKTEQGEKAIADLLKLADVITVRDSASELSAEKMTGRTGIVLSGDPAVKYLQSKYADLPLKKDTGILCCFLREVTDEYYNGTAEGYIIWRNQVEKSLADNIKQLCRERNLRPRFCSMHNFVIGGDDRDFYYRFADQQAFEKGSYDIDSKLTGIDVVAEAIANAELSLCMRFHSMVFADTLGADYLSIDYTNGGKIKCYLDDVGKAERLVTLAELQTDSGAIAGKVREVYGG